MANWNYEAHDKYGKPSIGEIEAATEQDAAQELRKRGLFARELSQNLIKAKYDRGALTSDVVPDDPGPVDTDGNHLRLPLPETRTANVQKNLAEDVAPLTLIRDLEAISEVVRRMERWAKAYKDTAPDAPLPSGTPSMGSKAWAIYSESRDRIVAGLIERAMDREVQRG